MNIYFSKARYFCLFFLFIAQPLTAQLYKLESNDLKLIYIDRSYSYMAPHTARTFLNSMTFHRKFWDYKPCEDVTVLLNDFSDYGNGGTMTIPRNFISIGIAPFEYTFDVMPSNERMQWLMSHELTHTVMTDKASSGDNFYRSVFFGKVQTEAANPLSMVYSYLTTPRWYSPRWFHEGIAVFMETWMSGGMGRVLGGYDEMVFRAMVKDSAYFYRVIGLESEGTTIDFQVGVNSYLYGTRFVSYLAYKHGIQKLKNFYSRSDSSSRFYASQFKNVYGVTVEDEWESWINSETEFQKNNLESVNKYPLTENKKILSFPLGSVSKSFYDREKRLIYTAVNYPGSLSQIISMNIDNGEIKKLADSPTPLLYYVTSLAYDDSSKTLFTSTHNQNWRGLGELNVESGKINDLIKFTRAGDFAFNKADKSVWAIQHIDGRVNIIRISPPYNRWDDIYTIPFGKSFFDIDISSDGKKLSGTLSEVTGKQKLIIFYVDSLLAGINNYEDIYEFEDNSASNFIFSKDNEYLIGTSYYTGVSNVYRVNIKKKNFELLSNTDIGYFRPLQISDDTLLVYEYTTNGLKPCLIKAEPQQDAEPIKYFGQVIKETNPEVETWLLLPPSKINIDSLTKFEGKYSEISSLGLTFAYPIIEGYKDFLAYGMRFNFADNVSIHSFNFSVSYSPVKFLPQRERLHILMDYRYWDWELKAALNNADFYDIFGPTKQSRAGYYYSLKYFNNLIYFKPENLSYFIRLSAYGDLERVPEYQNVNATFDKLYSLLLNINYSYTRKSLGAVESEQGMEFSLYSNNNFVSGKVFPKIYSGLDLGLLLPIRNSSLWLRTAAGFSFGERANPFNNFYFGGFGNNYVDHQPVQRYREMESFPGLEINEVGGNNFGKATMEWNLTPLRFRKLGFLSFYSTYTRLSFFGSIIALDLDKSSIRKEYYSAGSQLDFELVLFTLLKSTLSFGYARAFAGNRHPSNEYMMSLKIM